MHACRTLIDLSLDPEKRRLPEMARARTRELWPFSVCRQRIVLRSHTWCSICICMYMHTWCSTWCAVGTGTGAHHRETSETRETRETSETSACEEYESATSAE